MLKIKQVRTPVYHPQTGGLVERFNRTLKGMLRACIQGDLRKWESILPTLLLAIRETPQASMGCTPFELVYEHKQRGLLDIICEGWSNGSPEEGRQTLFV